LAATTTSSRIAMGLTESHEDQWQRLCGLPQIGRHPLRMENQRGAAKLLEDMKKAGIALTLD